MDIAHEFCFCFLGGVRSIIVLSSWFCVHVCVYRSCLLSLSYIIIQMALRSLYADSRFDSYSCTFSLGLFYVAVKVTQ